MLGTSTSVGNAAPIIGACAVLAFIYRVGYQRFADDHWKLWWRQTRAWLSIDAGLFALTATLPLAISLFVAPGTAGFVTVFRFLASLLVGSGALALIDKLEIMKNIARQRDLIRDDVRRRRLEQLAECLDAKQALNDFAKAFVRQFPQAHDEGEAVLKKRVRGKLGQGSQALVMYLGLPPRPDAPQANPQPLNHLRAVLRIATQVGC